MFTGTYLGQVPRSGWNAVPAAIVAAAVLAKLLTREKSLLGVREFTHHGLPQDG
jgi:hypothetical protein